MIVAGAQHSVKPGSQCSIAVFRTPLDIEYPQNLKLSNQGASIDTLQNQLTHYNHLLLLGRTVPK